jgi:hypothetical protein
MTPATPTQLMVAHMASDGRSRLLRFTIAFLAPLAAVRSYDKQAKL